MKRRAIAERFAAELHVSPGSAADELDRVVYGILQRLKSGQAVRLPGIGKFAAEKKAAGKRQGQPRGI